MNLPVLILHILLLFLSFYFLYRGIKGIVTKKMKARNPFHSSSSSGLLGVVIKSQLSPYAKKDEAKYEIIVGWSAIGRASLYLLFGVIILCIVLAGLSSGFV